MSLFGRFFFIFLGLALAPVLAMGVWVLNSNDAVRENAQSFHAQVAQLAVESVEASAAEMNRSLAFTQDLEQEDRKNAALAIKLVQRAAVTHPGLVSLSLMDESGRETARVADPRVFPATSQEVHSSDPLLVQARKTGQAAVGEVTLRQGLPLVPLVYPLSDGRVLHAFYSLEPLWRRLGKQKVGQNGRLLLLDPAGRPLSGIGDGFPQPGWAGVGPLPGRSGWLDAVSTRSGTMVGAWARADSLPLYVLSLQPRSEAYAQSDSVAVQAFSFLFLLAAGVGVGAYVLTGRLTKPLDSLISGAQRASRKDFKPVPELGWGELKLLSRQFNAMMSTLKSYEELHVDTLMEEKAKVEALVHNIPDGIVLADFHGVIVYMNASARTLLDAGRAGHKTIHEVLREPVLREMAISLMRGKKRSEKVEIELKTKEGTRLGMFLCRGVTVARGDRDIGILLLLRDVTHERELDSMKDEFFHSIVHDLRSPLTAIDGFVQLMQESKLGEREQVYVKYVSRSTSRLKTLVTDILQTAKLESGTVELKLAPVEASEILESIRSLYAMQGEARKVELVFTLGDGPLSVTCDRGLVERVIMNLLSNALKFTPDGGRIEFRITGVGSEVEFSLQDSGSGIPAHALESVFEKFKQLEDGINLKSGYGLGLSICKKIVELHGGRIWAESQERKGSRFVFRLPASVSSRAA